MFHSQVIGVRVVKDLINTAQWSAIVRKVLVHAALWSVLVCTLAY